MDAQPFNLNDRVKGSGDHRNEPAVSSVVRVMRMRGALLINRQLWLAAGLSLLVGCAPIAPTPSAPLPSSPPASASPEVSITPAPPSPSPTTVALLFVSVQVLEQCGSEGGCAYYADLTDGQGRITTERIDITKKSLPRRLPVGVYTLTFRSSLMSDVFISGAPSPGETPDAACTTTLEVAPGQARIIARSVFRADSCEVVITTS